MPDPVEFIPLGGSSSVSIGGVQVRGYEESERTGAQHAPKHKTESGYEFTTRVGAQAVEVKVTGWVNSSEFAALAQLENRREPIPAMGPNFSLPTATIDRFVDNMPGSAPGAHHVTIDVREVQQASTGTTTLKAVGPTGTKTAEGGGAEGGGGTGGGPSLVQTTGKD